MTAAFYLKHGLSQAALDDYLSILKIGIPELEDDSLMKSPYLFLKKYKLLSEGIVRIFPCTKCEKRLVNDSDGFPKKKQPCHHDYFEETSDKCYTLLLPLEPQLEYFIQHYGDNLKRCNQTQCSTEIGDVPTGRLYKKYRAKGLIDDHTLSLQLNSDAAQIWKHSEYKFQPFMVLVNEAPYKVRRSNVGLVALWYGNKKPPRSVFLDPVVDELNRLRRDGFMVDQSRYFIQPTITSVDTIERCEMNNTSQFNGKCGCDWCLHPGIHILLYTCFDFFVGAHIFIIINFFTGQVVKRGKGNSRCYCVKSDELKTVQPTPFATQNSTCPPIYSFSYPLRDEVQYERDLEVR